MNNKKSTVIDTHHLKKYLKRVRSIDKQEPNESRRLWYHVTQALNKQDFNLASVNKSLIEKQYKQLASSSHVSNYFNKNLLILNNDNANTSDSQRDESEVKYEWTNKNF